MSCRGCEMEEPVFRGSPVEVLRNAKLRDVDNAAEALEFWLDQTIDAMQELFDEKARLVAHRGPCAEAGHVLDTIDYCVACGWNAEDEPEPEEPKGAIP